jgi:subtilisin family serine protease
MIALEADSHLKAVALSLSVKRNTYKFFSQMKKNNYFFLALICCLLTLLVEAQKNYQLKLNGNDLLPVDNVNSISKQDPVFTSNKFAGKYYLIIQFHELPTERQKQQLNANGIRLIDYLPNYAYTAVVSENVNLESIKTMQSGIRGILALNSSQKSSAAINQRSIPKHAVKQARTVDLTVITYEAVSTETMKTAISSLNATIINSAPAFRSFEIRMPQSSYYLLANVPLVQWMEFVAPPNTEENLLGRTLHRVNILQDGVRNLKGDGINLGIWDGGPVFQHTDFGPAGRLTIVEQGSASSHGTHCAGTLAGAGILNPIAKGMAPNAKLYSWNFSGDIQVEMQAGIPNYNLDISSHSYGAQSHTGPCAANNTDMLSYSSRARATDIVCNNYPTHLHVHSAGNAAATCPDGYYTITGSGKAAKNNLVVANIASNETWSMSSSAGPVLDGRIKPEIASMGSSVFSTVLDNAYGNNSGTSMATPGVAGAAALVYQRYKQLNSNNAPASSLVKNLLCNTAIDLGNPGPDYKFGFGRIDALAAVEALEENRFASNTSTTGISKQFTITVPANTVRLKVMLTWNDPAGAANATTALVNNLDLFVVKGTDTAYAWKLNKDNPAAFAFKGRDNISNIEQVVTENPSGTYTILVEGVDVPQGPQQYFVTWVAEQQGIKLQYPNGAERFSPGTSETITWNNAGITGPQTVEYSLNNGTTWTVISSTIPAQTSRLPWAIPANAFSTSALIRVSSSNYTDVSDANFTIMSVVTGLTASTPCSAGEVLFSWRKLANASAYDLLSLDPTTGQMAVAAANLVDTTHKLTGLVPGSSNWYAVVAKNGTTAGERTNAVRGTASSTTAPNLGSITGASSTCVGSTNIAYAVPALTGITNYNWTVPAGATIVTGQGTTTITVNYPNGSSSGNITVTGQTSPGCSTAASISTVVVKPRPTKPIIASNGLPLSTAGGLSAYQWYKNDTAISEATTNTYTPTENGIYKVEVTNGDGCKNISDAFNFILTSLNEILVQGSTVAVFPNPAKNVINVKLLQQITRRVDWSLISADGRLIQQSVLRNGLSQINTLHVPSGIYFLQLGSGNESKSIKVQVVH